MSLHPLRAHAIVALLVLVGVLAPRAAPAAPEGGEAHHLAWRATYEAALLEARIRNLPVLVFRHKDECGRCVRQRASVLTQKAFVTWARDRVVPLVAHNERLHDPIEVVVDGETVDRCPLYPGLTCRDHVRAAVDIEGARGEGLVPVPFLELCPNTWLVAPDDAVERVAEEDQFDPQAVRRQVEALQKRLGPPLPEKRWPGVRAQVTRAAAALDEEAWRRALEAYAEVARLVPEPHAALRGLVAQRLASVDEVVGWDAEDLLEQDAPDDAARERARALLAAVDVEIWGQRLPVRDRLAAWLERHP